MKNIVFVLCAVVLFVSCSDEQPKHADTSRQPPSTDERSSTDANNETEKTTGNELYLQNCAGCHGKDRTGNPPDIPALRTVGERRSRSFIRNRIRTGKGIMPSFSFLSADAQEAIVDYLLNPTSSETAKEEPVTPVERGKRLFVSNCARCHQATTNDPEPPGMPSGHPMNPAPMAGVTKRFTRETFDRILNRGPAMMPSFSYLSRSNRDALWAYVETLEGKGEPDRPTMLERHPGMLHERHPKRHRRRRRRHRSRSN